MESEMEGEVVREYVAGARVANRCRGCCDVGLCSRVVGMVRRCSFDRLTSRFFSLSKKMFLLSGLEAEGCDG